MIQDADIKVLTELNRIVEQYGPDSVLRLAALIRDPQSAADIATALENAAERTSQRKSRSKYRSTERIGIGVLNELRESDPQKHSLVADFRDRLLSGTLLRSMSEVRHFARMHDLSIGKASSRNAAIVPLLRSIADLETSAIIDLLDSITESGVNDRSLERWRDLIVKPRPSHEAEKADNLIP